VVDAAVVDEMVAAEGADGLIQEYTRRRSNAGRRQHPKSAARITFTAQRWRSHLICNKAKKHYFT
jgi:hypothetical protein